MFDYTIQYPNINYSAKYTPRSVRKSSLSTASRIDIDISPLEREGNVNYIPGDIGDNILAGAIWGAAVLNLHASKIELPFSIIRILGDTELGLNVSCSGCGSSLYAIVERVNTTMASFDLCFDLYRIATWDELLLTMMEGYTPLIGGSVYSSFMTAKDTGIVPIPKPGEDLLGGHVVNLVSFDRDQDTGMAVGNLGMAFGNYGMLTYRGSYLRNLSICRDFFVLIPRSIIHAH